ncbi:hypothetical protein Pint_30039 [Pistacia integerrima]|uniref:Uncharacterized protein n=1 Tax=Pistacia integerrima TaxID=434235 RepID=A0ACC0WZI6_9ROSI|nr:hypothetical protein Pint_30039 [Pistacia integerrima]
MAKRFGEKQEGIIRLHGTGGVGKTTLLTQINNNFYNERNDFDVVIWVVVSKDHQAEKIQEEIGEKIDGIWERVDLTKVGIPHPDPNNGSNMAGEDPLNNHPDILELARIVAKECGGLPLALITIGRAMTFKKTPEEWSYAIEVLKRSASEFPDSTVDKRDLIDRWIGEGYLDEYEGIGARKSRIPLYWSLIVTECPDMDEIIDISKFGEVQKIMGNLNPFAKVNVFTIQILPKLKSIHRNAFSFPLPRQMYISECPLLKKLPLDSSCAITNKHEFVIRGDKYWWEEFEWEDEATQNVFLPFFRSSH